MTHHASDRLTNIQGLSDGDIFDVGSPRMLNENVVRMQSPRKMQDDSSPKMVNCGQSGRLSISSVAGVALLPELDFSKRCQPMSTDWPARDKQSAQLLSTEENESARLRRLEGDLRKLDCEGCITQLRKEQQATLTEIRCTAAQLEAGIADCRRELESQREQLQLHADAASEVSQKTAEEGALRDISPDALFEEMRKIAWEAAREAVREAVQGLDAAEVHELRGRIQDAERRLLEMASSARQHESTFVARDELRDEMRRIRMEVQAMQQEHFDKFSVLSGQLTQTLVRASEPEVTTKASGDKKCALDRPRKDVITELPALEDAKTDALELFAALSGALAPRVKQEEELLFLRQALEETHSSMNSLVQDFEERFSGAADLASIDRAAVADLRGLVEETYRALAEEVSEERIARSLAVDEVSSRSDAVVRKTMTLIDEVTQARWNGLSVGDERSGAIGTSAADSPYLPQSME